MTIELGFTSDGLKQCEHALCRNYRRRIVGFRYVPPKDGTDEFTLYRRQKTPEQKCLAAAFGEITERVHFRGLPRELATKWRKEISDKDKVSAWHELPSNGRQRVCQACPVRPADEENCYDIYFSNCPGIIAFKQGFILTILWLMDTPRCHASGDIESLRERVLELYRLCKGARISHLAEGLSAMLGSLEAEGIIGSFCPRITGTEIGEHGLELLVELPDESSESGSEADIGEQYTQQETERERLGFVPFVDELVSKFIYDERPGPSYITEEIRLILPPLEALAQAACRAADFMRKLDYADKKEEVSELADLIESFQGKVEKLIVVLRIGEKYNLGVEMHL